ncbi:MAG: DUF4258 domain-containing protein [Verrucomicrobiota bacterium]|nr:DUF4258 domain-containing protein [Verrucomicrobiota bacterium]
MKPIRWTPHAQIKVAKREIDKVEVELTIRQPDSIISAQPPRQFYQRRYLDKALNAEMLLRVVVEETDSKLTIVTVYKSSKFEKYERGKSA